jgi:hypothetical protein
VAAIPASTPVVVKAGLIAVSELVDSVDSGPDYMYTCIRYSQMYLLLYFIRVIYYSPLATVLGVDTIVSAIVAISPTIKAWTVVSTSCGPPAVSTAISISIIVDVFIFVDVCVVELVDSKYPISLAMDVVLMITAVINIITGTYITGIIFYVSSYIIF